MEVKASGVCVCGGGRLGGRGESQWWCVCGRGVEGGGESQWCVCVWGGRGWR